MDGDTLKVLLSHKENIETCAEAINENRKAINHISDVLGKQIQLFLELTETIKIQEEEIDRLKNKINTLIRY